MLKDIRSKVMRIANRLVGQGKERAEAMLTAWRIVRYKALRTKINGTSFDNRQNVLQLLCKYNPAKPDSGNTTAPMETMTKGRVYVTIDKNNEPKYITYHDKKNKRYTAM